MFSALTLVKLAKLDSINKFYNKLTDEQKIYYNLNKQTGLTLSRVRYNYELITKLYFGELKSENSTTNSS